MKGTYPFALIIILLTSFSSTIQSSPGIYLDDIDYTNPKLPSSYQLPKLSDNVSYAFNIVFLGYNTTRFNVTLFQDSLPNWHAPIERIPSNKENGYLFDINYTLSYDFQFFGDQEVLQYQQFLLQHRNLDTSPYWSQNDSETISYIDSYAIESYLTENYVESGEPTFIFIDTYTLSPSNHNPYFYNASTVDLDGSSVPRRYGSQYQISGGGGDSRLLWLDLSSGPTKYRDTDYWGYVGVNETTIPPIWMYGEDDGSKNSLALDLATYLTTAIELRFLPSYIYTPAFATQEVLFDFKLINLDTSGFDWFNAINLDLITDEYSRLNPNINWTTEIEEINLDSYPVFKNIIDTARDDGLRTYNSFPIMEYLDQNYSQFLSSTKTGKLVIPVFLFGFEENYLFDYFLGVATSMSYEFSYIISSTNVYFAEKGMKLSTEDWFAEGDLQLQANSYLTISGLVGSTYEELLTNITVQTGQVNIYVVDQNNLQRYQNSDTPNNLYLQTGITDSHSFTMAVNVYQNLTWIIENPHGSNASVNLTIDSYKDRSFGFTFVSMHEIGHALGLSHPHDGFTWFGNKHFNAETDYLYWLWDLSDTQMTYAHHYPNISKLDIDTYQRSIFPKLYSDTYSQFYSVIDQILTENTYVPSYLVPLFDGMIGNMSQAINWFSNQTVITNYQSALNNIDSVMELVSMSQQLMSVDDLGQVLQVNIFGQTTEIVRIEIFDHNTLMVNETLTTNAIYNLTSLTWSDYTIKVFIDGAIDQILTGFTWSMPENVDIYMGSATPPPTSSDSDPENSDNSKNTNSTASTTDFLPGIHLTASLIFILVFSGRVSKRKTT